MNALLELYHYYNTEVADARTNDWPLISSPIPLALITITYLYIILNFGPKYMRGKPPYKLNTFIKFYDVFQIVTNAWVVYELLENGWYQDYFFYCKNIEYHYSYEPKPYKMSIIAWYVLLMKVLDYFDTILFVLRKKNQQVTFLHVYHHITTSFFSWLIVKYVANGMIMTIPLINCFIHVLMYNYYLFASFGSQIRAIVQVIKPMITIAQIIQFWIFELHMASIILSTCHTMRFICSLILINVTVLLYLFHNFYKVNYSQRKSKYQ